MLDIDNALDQAGTQRLVVSVTPVVVEEVTVTVASPRGGYKAIPDSEWGWSDLRDYIVQQIEDRHGPQVRDPIKEAGICKAFMSRWGAEIAVAIARSAFEVHDGWWKNAPISMTRFCKASDVYFAQPIADRL